MTDSVDRNTPRDGEPDALDMRGGARDYAMWDAAYVLGSRSDPDRREFEAHLDGCTSCRQAVTELTAISPLLSVLDYDHVVAPDGADGSAAAPPCPDLLTSMLAKAERQPSPAPAAAVVDVQTASPASVPATTPRCPTS